MSKLLEIKVPVEKLAKNRQQSLHHWQAKKRRQKVKMSVLTTVVTAAALFFIFLSTGKISPTVSSYVAQLPGMGWLKEEIKNDSTLEAIIKNDYYISLNTSAKTENVAITLVGLIADHNTMRIYFEAENLSGEKFPDYRIKLLKDGEEMDDFGLTIPFDSDEDGVIHDLFEVYLPNNPIQLNDLYELSIMLENGDNLILPFKISEPIAQTKFYELNEEIVIEGQLLTVKTVEVSPLKTVVTFAADKSNDMQILQLESLQLVDQDGNEWSSLKSGFISSGSARDASFQYILESNYFEQPTELYLVIDKVQAIHKEDAYITITENNDVLMPAALDQWSAEIIGNKFVLQEIKETKPNLPVVNTLIDAKGKIHHATDLTISEEEQFVTTTFTVPKHGTAPLSLQVDGYPNYINEELIIITIK